MKILLDHCVPRPIRRLLPAHEVSTTFEMGWSTLQNGKLLAAAGQLFEVVLTVDQNIQHEQNIALLPISIIVMVANSNRLEAIEPLIPMVEQALSMLHSRQLLRVSLDSGIVPFTE